MSPLPANFLPENLFAFVFSMVFPPPPMDLTPNASFMWNNCLQNICLHLSLLFQLFQGLLFVPLIWSLLCTLKSTSVPRTQKQSTNNNWFLSNQELSKFTLYRTHFKCKLFPHFPSKGSNYRGLDPPNSHPFPLKLLGPKQLISLWNSPTEATILK